MGDAGLFGPGSVTWRVHADPVMGIGGLRALLLQALHPDAMAVVAEHSGFRDDPWGRLLRTVAYVETVSFGTAAAAVRAGERVRAVHRALPAAAEDPQLLRWVHCCLVDSFLETYQRAGGGLSPAEADTYVAEQSRGAALVGLDPTSVPVSVADLRASFTAYRPALRATPAAREAAAFVLLPPMPRRWLVPAKPLWVGVAGTAFALLPRWARRAYSFPGLPTTDLAATAAVRTLRRSLLLLPAARREAPAVRAARARAS